MTSVQKIYQLSYAVEIPEDEYIPDWLEGLDTGGFHAFNLYDPDTDGDNDPTTGNGMQIISGNWGVNYNPALGDALVIEARDNATDSRDWINTFAEGKTLEDLNANVILSGQTAEDAWTGTNGMFTFAKSLGTYNATHDLYITNHTYEIFARNSDSANASVLNAQGLDFINNRPLAHDDHLSLEDPVRFPGHMGILDGSGDDNFTAYAHAFEPSSYVFYDSGGNDTIGVENGASIHILNDGFTSGSNTLILKDFDPADLRMTQEGDNLIIWDTSGLIDVRIVVLYDHFGENGPGVVQLQIDNGGSITTIPAANLDSGDLGNIISTTPSWYTNTQIWFGVTITGWWDPLAIDLDGDGIERIGNGRYFDLDNNGLAENTAWLHANDGFLAIDLNENGRIDNGGELFGTATVDGFSALAAYDSNSDGVINSSDTIWSDLIIWQDKNSDGQTQSDEMLTLASFNITGIDVENVTATGSTANVNGGIITHTGTVTTTTGTMDIANLNFIRDTTNTRAAVDYDLNIETLFLPDVRGYSNVMSLRDALNVNTTADTANSTTLLEKMQSIAAHSMTDFFANYSTIVETLEEAMFQWAGVVDVSPTSRGIYLSDARMVEFFEEYFGQGFVDRNEWGTNPGIVQANGIEDLWNNEIFTRLKANIFMQMAPAALFEAGINYNYAEDILTLADGASKELSLDVLDALEDAASALSTTGEREAFWIGVLDVLHSVRMASSFGDTSNYVGLTSTEVTALDTAITDSDSSLDFDGVLYRLQNPLGETIEGTSGNDTGGSQINGTANDDTLSGLAGADTIDAGAGNDTVYGHNHDGSGDDNANDRVYGVAGNDTLYGGGGHDTLDGGAGSDHIYGGDGNDVLVDGYRETVASQNLLEGEAGDDSYYISYAQIDSNSDVESVYIIDSSGSDSIRFRNGNSDDLGDDQKYLLSNLSFKRLIDHDLIITALNGNNATTITIADQLSDLNNSTGLGIEIIRLWNGSSYYSLDLKDYLLNYSGAMVTWGTNAADVINGITIGSLNDDIRGFDGDDVIHGNAGNDVIRGDGGNDTLYGDEGNDTLDGGSGYSILYGGDGNDTLAGGGELYGEAGNDTLVGSSTIDVLSGGDGDDNMQGGQNNDTYIFSSGTDSISEFGATADVDTLIMTENSLPEDYSYSISGSNLVITGASGTVTILNQFQSHQISQKIYRLEKIQFSDGFYINDYAGEASSWVFDTNQSTSSDETINGNLVAADGGTDRIYMYSGGGSVSGGADSDFIYGNSGHDLMHGGSGNDFLQGGSGNDRIWGSTGTDTASFASASDSVTVNLLAGTATGEGNDELYGIENILGSNYNDTLTGDGNSNSIAGGLGNDTISSQGGADIITGDAGTDALHGGDGNDEYLYDVGDGQDTITDSSGTDQITFGAGIEFSDLTFAQVGDDLEITFAGTVTDKITITDFYVSSDTIEILEFDDTSSYDLSNLLNSAPVAEDDAVSANYGTTPITGNVFADNGSGTDSDSDSDPLSVVETSVISAAGVTVSLSSNGNFSYTPSEDMLGSDTFDYTVSDGQGGTDVATVTITVISPGGAVTGTSGANTLNGTSSAETIIALAGNDTISAAAGNDVIYGGGGNDSISGGADNDTINGGAGTDTIDYSSASGAMTINLAVGTATGEGTDSLSNIENVSGSAYADTMIGNTGANSLTGNAGNDTLNGGAGADSLTGGANNDIFVLDDTTFSGADTIQDFNSSNDKIIIANLFPYYDPWIHNITHYVQIVDSGSNSILSVDVDGGANSFVQVATIIGVTGLTNELALQNSDTVRTYNTISGTSGADTLTGGANFDYIFADYGNDTLYGGAGNDRLDGAWDNDTLYGQDGNDVLEAGSGNDTLYGGAGADILYSHGGNDIFVLDDTTFSGVDTIQDFNSSNDKIIIANLFPYYDPWIHTITDYVQITDSGSNSILKVDIDGGGNNFVQVATIIGVTGLTNELALQNSDTVRTYNTISGTTGADTLTGGANFDYIFADYGNDTLYGGAGNDRLDGAWDNDTLYGQDGNDVLEAGSGNDTLYGGAGADILYSHGGNDIFVLDDTTFSGVDTIQDFNSSNDKIDIADVLVGYDALKEAITDFVQITTSGSNSILSVDADGGANNFVQIATIIGVTGLTNEEALETAGTLITV